MTDKIDKFRAAERARMQPMREAARREAFVQGYIAGCFPRDNATPNEILAELPKADVAYTQHILSRRGPA